MVLKSFPFTYFHSDAIDLVSLIIIHGTISLTHICVGTLPASNDTPAVVPQALLFQGAELVGSKAFFYCSLSKGRYRFCVCDHNTWHISLACICACTLPASDATPTVVPRPLFFKDVDLVDGCDLAVDGVIVDGQVVSSTPGGSALYGLERGFTIIALQVCLGLDQVQAGIAQDIVWNQGLQFSDSVKKGSSLQV